MFFVRITLIINLLFEYMKNKHIKDERSLVIIKPDGVQRALIGEVVKRFEQVGRNRTLQKRSFRRKKGIIHLRAKSISNRNDT